MRFPIRRNNSPARRHVAAAALTAWLQLTAAAAATAADPEPADFVFQNGTIYTVNQAFTTANAVAIKDGHIAAVGSNRCLEPYVGNATKVIDLQGHMVMPGLIDAHMHTVSGGQFLLKCNLQYQTLPIEDILTHVQGCVDSDPKADDTWLEVVNMDYAGLSQKSGTVTKLDLDKLSTRRPVIFRSSDYHVVIANSRALELSDITADIADPAGGVIERLTGSQEPSGVLKDSAYSLLKAPPPSDAEYVDGARAALKLLREAGVTTFQEAAAQADHHKMYDTLRKEDALSARAYFDLQIEAPVSHEAIEGEVSRVKTLLTSLNDASEIGPKPTLKWHAIKAFIDGVITYPTLTAALVDPYWLPVNGTNEWAPANSTLKSTYWKPDILAATLEQLFLQGIDAQLHVDGDLAVKVGLDAAEAFREKHPGHDFRLGLAHDEVTQAVDWPRFAELAVDAIMSFQWAQQSSFTIPDTFASLGEYRLDKLQAAWQIEGAGRPVVFGSDWPIDPLDEFLALKVGVTRRGDPQNPNSAASQGPPFDSPHPGKGLTREQVIRAITINAAKFLRADDKIGSIEKGKLADLVILEKNFFEVPDEELGRNRVLVTVVGGEVVYVADKAPEFTSALEPKFPNADATHSQRFAKRSLGGFAGQSLSPAGKAQAARLRKRGECGHKH